MAHKYILDAPVLIWYLEANPLLSDQAKTIIDDPESELVLPIVALAEAIAVIERGKTSVPGVRVFLDVIEVDPRLEIYPITWELFQHSLTKGLENIPDMHHRLIVATALYLESMGHTVSLLTKKPLGAVTDLVSIVW